MQPSSPLVTRRRAALLVTLMVLLASIYMITYSARIETGDSRFLFDAVGSSVDYGDLLLDLSAWQRSPIYFGAELAYPLETFDIEPLPVLLLSPLYALAKAVPGIGLVHTVWLFNVFVGAAAGGVMFLYALALGHSERVAILGALLLGVASVLFPYTRTLFREPLMLLMLLLAGLMIERLRANGYRSIRLWILAGLAVIGLILSKASALLALPALLLLLLPPLKRLDRRLLLALGIGGLLIGVVIALLSVFGAERYNFINRLLRASGDQFPTALAAYLISPGASLWATSPIALLALPGVALLARGSAGGWRYAVAVPLLALSLAVGYAALNGVHWFGGLSWPPRFLIPVVPYLILAGLPVLEWLISSPQSTDVDVGAGQSRNFWKRIASILVALLIAYSVWAQLSGVTLWWGEYARVLPPESGGVGEWLPALYQPRYFRWVLLPSLWGRVPFDFAWVDIDAPVYAIAFVVLAVLCVFTLWKTLSEQRNLLNLPLRLSAISALSLLIVLAFYLPALYRNDNRYLSGNDTLPPMLSMIQDETVAGDVVLLTSRFYEPYFANAGKLDPAADARLITLTDQPGEQPSPEQPPLVRSDYPAALLTTYTPPLIHHLAERRDRLWLLSESGPDLWWSVRPLERFMTSHYYPLRTLQTGPRTRLIEYSTASAPDAFSFVGADISTDLAYGDSLRLLGLTLPNGTMYAPGDALPVSLYWSSDAPLEPNYTVALFLRDANGMPIADSQWQPAMGFAPTSDWRPGVPVWDNRAVRIPADAVPGTYQLWVKVYDFEADGSTRDLEVRGENTLDRVIGVLPVVIRVE
jgi:hypothetical protein